MGCDFPIKAFRSRQLTETGKSYITFNPIKGRSQYPMELPCGKCIGCKLERSRQWAVRMVHESKCWDDNCFLTLTYAEDKLPNDYGLHLDHWQKFMRRLRKATPQKIRFFACGEYGDRLGRPHYHSIMFNLNFSDRKLWSDSDGKRLYVSEHLDNLWTHGQCWIGPVTFDSAAYVARYCTKKITGPVATDHYCRMSPIDGKIHHVSPEFAVMSRKPGIGSTYVDKFKGDFYPSGFIISNDVKQRPPRFYVNRLSEKEQRTLKRQSRVYAMAHRADNTPERREVRAEARDLRIKQLKRTLG